MKLTSTSFSDGQKIPVRYAFGKMDAATHCALSDNVNPQFSWSDVPAGTKSFVLICHDYDVPSKGDDVNVEGRTIPASLPRVDFYHWLLIDLPASLSSVAEGEFSSGITPRGKPGPDAKYGARQGVNDYTPWFASDKDMAGDYYGYDGPCPPWNDTIAHHYVYTVYALDVEKLDVPARFTGPDVMAAMKGHILASAAITGVFSLNPDVEKTL